MTGILQRFVEGLFFRGDSRTYWSPWHFGLKAEEFAVQGSCGQVCGMLLRPVDKAGKPAKPRGTVLFCNSGDFNMQYALIQSAWLCHKGFNLVMFDYAGFGSSPGTPSLEGILADARAVLGKVRDGSLAGVDPGRLVLFGQGVGADCALRLWKDSPDGILAVAAESAYATQPGRLKSCYGPLIGDAAASLVPATAVQPLDVVSSITVPLLLIYPSGDSCCRESERSAMVRAAGSRAEVWHVQGAKYLKVFAGGSIGPWHDGLVRFFAEALDPQSKKA